MSESATLSPLAEFAQEQGLRYEIGAELPKQGDLLNRGGRVGDTATGTLPGGVEGTLAHYTYTYTWTDSDNHSHSEERPFTFAVIAIPESIGFVPYLGFSGAASHFSASAGGEDMAPIDMSKSAVLKRGRAMAYKGTRETWLAQLFSPALIQWLERCDEDFGFELAGGVLCAGRGGHIAAAAELTAVCEDAAHLATAIRQESLEEVGTGEEAEAATDPHAEDPRRDATLERVGAQPDSIGAAVGTFRADAWRSPYTYWRALRYAVLLTLVLNIPGLAVPIVLSVNGWFAALAIIEGSLIAIIFCFALRSRVGTCGREYAAEAFYRGYARSRELTIEEPLKFAATHAEAKLPFKPDRVFSGVLPGGANGALAIAGDGSKRSDRIAVLAGPRGPFAEAELQAEAQGIDAELLDRYAKSLSAEVAEDVATRPT